MDIRPRLMEFDAVRRRTHVGSPYQFSIIPQIRCLVKRLFNNNINKFLDDKNEAEINFVKEKLTKDYNEIIVEENEVADYTIFIEIPEKYGALKQIDEPTRKTISLYMQANNLKLSVGTHRFNRVDGTLEEYLNEEFKFEVIK